MPNTEPKGLTRISQAICFDGEQSVWEHRSESCDAPMRFASWLPIKQGDRPLPWLLWLSGLTCNEDNFMVKAGAQRYAAEHGIALIAPDTSPRNTGIPGEDDDWDFGSGAGFYVNATQAPWSAHYRMYDYVCRDLPALVSKSLGLDPDRVSISGHSMGGHGALTVALKNPGRFRSVSAFSPICSPMRCPWGEKALGGYLGHDRETWREYDSCELVAKASERLPLLIDQGGGDEFLKGQLRPELLRNACKQNAHPLDLRIRPGYDHGYFFVSTFIGDHLRHHAKALQDS